MTSSLQPFKTFVGKVKMSFHFQTRYLEFIESCDIAPHLFSFIVILFELVSFLAVCVRVCVASPTSLSFSSSNPLVSTLDCCSLSGRQKQGEGNYLHILLTSSGV